MIPFLAAFTIVPPILGCLMREHMEESHPQYEWGVAIYTSLEMHFAEK
jgi:hypothetical protein